MSFKHAILGLCVSAAALTGAVSTVSAAGGEASFAARPTSGTLSASPAPAAVSVASTGGLFGLQVLPAFDDAQAKATATEEALPVSSLAMLVLAAALAVGLLMARRSSNR